MRTQLHVSPLRCTCVLGALNLPMDLTAQRSCESHEKAPTFLVAFFLSSIDSEIDLNNRAPEVARRFKPRFLSYRRLPSRGGSVTSSRAAGSLSVPVAAASRVSRPREEGALPSFALSRQPLLPSSVAPKIDYYLRDTVILCPAPVVGRFSLFLSA